MRSNEILDSTSTRSSKRIDSTSMRSIERLDSMGEVTVSFFNELDT